jgi:hypothetical protein
MLILDLRARNMMPLSTTGFPGRSVRLTLAITWPQAVLGNEDSHAVADQVHGGVRE